MYLPLQYRIAARKQSNGTQTRNAMNMNVDHLIRQADDNHRTMA